MSNEITAVVASIQYGKILIRPDLGDDVDLLELEVGRNLPYKMQKELVVGDRVEMRRKGEEWRIIRKFKRINSLSRLKGKVRRPRHQIIAANIDLAVIVAAKAKPRFHPGLIDRYLILCRYGEIDPMICINKVDLEGEVEDLEVLPWYEQVLHVPVIETSAKQEHGLDALHDALRGKTAVLVGNSGVGKSSLVNMLLPNLDLKVGEVDKFGDGRHTTTISGLYQWAPGSFIIDTPGIRGLEVSIIPRDSLDIGFPEFSHFASQCAFSNCSHDHEPDCAVIAAVEQGVIAAVRYESYLSILASYEGQS